MPYSKFIQLQISQNKKMSLKNLTEIIIDIPYKYEFKVYANARLT